MPDFPNNKPSFSNPDPFATTSRGQRPAQRHEAQGEINTKQQTAFMAPKDPSSEGFETAAKIGNQLQQITLQWAESQDKMRLAKAKVTAEIGFMNLLEQAENDPDFDNAGEYTAKLSRIKNDSLKGFSSRNANSEAGLSIGLSEQRTAIQINSIFRKKEIDHTREVVIPQAVELFAKQKASAPYGSPGWQKLNQDFQTDVDGWVSSGLISQADQNKVIDEANYLQVAYEISGDGSTETRDSWVLKELQRKKGGRYDALDPIRRGELVKKALTKINENKKIMIDQTIDTRFQILKDFADNKINWQDEEIMNRLTIEDPELGEAIRKGTDTLFTPDPNDEAFVEATENIFSSSSREEVSTYLMNTLNQNANKEISRDRLAILINAATERAVNLRTQASDHPTNLSPKQAEIDAAVKSLVSKTNPRVSKAGLLTNFFNETAQGASPKDAHDIALKAETSRTNPLSTTYKIGDTITNQQGELGEVIGFNENGSPLIRRKK